MVFLGVWCVVFGIRCLGWEEGGVGRGKFPGICEATDEIPESRQVSPRISEALKRSSTPYTS